MGTPKTKIGTFQMLW